MNITYFFTFIGVITSAILLIALFLWVVTAIIDWWRYSDLVTTHNCIDSAVDDIKKLPPEIVFKRSEVLDLLSNIERHMAICVPLSIRENCNEHVLVDKHDYNSLIRFLNYTDQEITDEAISELMDSDLGQRLLSHYKE